MRVKNIIKTDPVREEEFLAHASWLLKIRDSEEDCVYQNIVKIPCYILADSTETLQHDIYDNFEDNYQDPSYLSKCLIMTSTNRVVFSENEKMLVLLHEPLTVSEILD